MIQVIDNNGQEIPAEGDGGRSDNRAIWEYDDCQIVPINCQHPTWGKCAEPIDFGDKIRNLYWRIDFPDRSWIHAGTKADCRSWIDSCKRMRPDRWTKPTNKERLR